MSAPASRRAGVMVPLFSLRSSRSWGIGDIGDLVAFLPWAASAGLRLVQLLPINEMPFGESSPYSAMSAMAIDPQFITMDAVDDFHALGGEAGLDPDLQVRLAGVRAASAVDYREVRTLKQAVLRRAFRRFAHDEWPALSPRARAFAAFAMEQAWWLDGYALFRALHDQHAGLPWTEWPEGVRHRDPAALAAASETLAGEVLFRKYVQWLAAEQWQAARQAARAAEGGVALFGDLPFMVALDSADVWERQREYRLDVSVGVPPDAFSETGQDWRLPAYDWDVFAANDFEWLRLRARRNAELFDGYRVDHLVGYYRTYVRPYDGSPARFMPAEQDAQTALGERVLDVFRSSGAEIVAEDLGTVPDFVRESLARLGVPGCKVMRWERQWNLPGQPFTDPVDYPLPAVATSGTHDTEPMVTWWAEAAAEERAAVLAIPSVGATLADDERADAIAAPHLSAAVRDRILAALYASGAMLIILPVQDLFGWDDRINQPATIGEHNWTWRMRWTVEELPVVDESVALAARLRAWAAACGR
jgi:4-alpha-glucanotransferase